MANDAQHQNGKADVPNYTVLSFVPAIQSRWYRPLSLTSFLLIPLLLCGGNQSLYTLHNISGHPQSHLYFHWPEEVASNKVVKELAIEWASALVPPTSFFGETLQAVFTRCPEA